MGIIIKILVFIVGMIAGVALIKYSFQLTRLFGYNYYAEKFLGEAGTYSMWRLLGVLVLIGTLIYVFS